MHQNTQSTSQDNDDYKDDDHHLYDYDNMCGANTTICLQIIFSHCLIFRYNHHIFIYIFSTTMPSCHKSSGAKNEKYSRLGKLLITKMTMVKAKQARRAGVV